MGEELLNSGASVGTVLIAGPAVWREGGGDAGLFTGQ